MTTSLLDLKYTTTPTQYAQAIAQLGKLVWWEPDQLWLVTDYEIAKSLLMDPRLSADRTAFFQRRTQQLGLPMISNFFSLVNNMMVVKDDPLHYPRRKICSHAISHYIKNSVDLEINKTLNHLLSKITSNAFDFQTAIAEPLPIEIMANILSVPIDERENFYQASLAMNMFFGGANAYLTVDGATLVDQRSAYLRRLFTDLLNEKRMHPSQDFISILLHHQNTYALTDEDLLSQIVMVLNAGIISLSDQICNAFYQLFTRPALMQYLRDNTQYISDAIKEGIRLDPTVTFTFRLASEDVACNGQTIKKDQAVFISNHAVNRDPAIFTEPNEIHFSNTKNKDFSFGYGSHFCLGYRLALLQMQHLLEKMLSVFSSISVDEANTRRRHDSLAFSGFERMSLSIVKK